MSSIAELLQCFEDSFQHPAEGDRCVMLAALYNRVKDKSLIQERTERPNRTRVIHKILEQTFEIPGLPKWGATAVRGNLMDNKEHIRKFIDIINALPEGEVDKAWDACGTRYKEVMQEKHVPIALNPEDSLMKVLLDLVDKPSGGRIQQPLCHAALSVYFDSQGRDYEVQSKRVFAGDAQSGVLGDTTVREGGAAVAVFEVKAHLVDATKIQEVLQAHGSHAYNLVIVGKDFVPDVGGRKNLTLVRIPDFVSTLAILAAAALGIGCEEATLRILERYNTIIMELEQRPDLCVDLSTVSLSAE